MLETPQKLATTRLVHHSYSVKMWKAGGQSAGKALCDTQEKSIVS